MVQSKIMLLASLFMVSFSGWVGYQLASGQCAGRKLVLAKAYAENQNQAVAATRARAEEESKRREATALREASRQSAAREARLKGQAHATQTARTECSWDDDRRMLINSAIGVANRATEANSPE